MPWFGKKTSPYFSDQKKCDEFLLSDNFVNTFPAPPAAVDFNDAPSKFMQGRDREFAMLQSLVIDSLDAKESRLIQIRGKQGIGKSTLVSELGQSIEEKGLDKKIIIVVLNATGSPADFLPLNFYRRLIESLKEHKMLSELAYTSIIEFIELLANEDSHINANLWQDIPAVMSNLNNLRTNPQMFKKLLLDQGDLLSKIEILAKKYHSIVPGKISASINYFLTLWHSSGFSIDSHDAYNALLGYGTFEGLQISTDAQSLSAIKSIIQLLNLTQESCRLVVVVDHLEACLNNPTENYNNLFSFLLMLRQIQQTCIILSGTFDAYQGIDNVIQGDMRLQLDNWASLISLSPIEPESIVEVVRYYLDDLWANVRHKPPHDCALYPFGKDALTYLYDETHQDIRKTLIRIRNVLEEFRIDKTVTPIITFFDAMRYFRPEDKGIELTELEKNWLVSKLMASEIQDKNRSTMVEKALCDALNRVKSIIPEISEIKHEPPIGKHGERPDIVITLFGDRGLAFVKRIAIEVKMYRVNPEIPRKEVNKTLKLLNDKVVHYVHWVANRPLNLDPDAHKDQDLLKGLGRFKSLNSEELAYISLLVHQQELFKAPLEAATIEEILDRTGLPIRGIISRVQKETIPTLLTIPITEPIQEKLPTVTTPTVPRPTIPTPTVESTIEKIIIQKIKNKNYIYFKTVLKELEKQRKDIQISAANKDDYVNQIGTIAEKLGHRQQATRIYPAS